jgi:hypothetical protein
MEQQGSTWQFLLAHAGLLTCQPRLAVSAPRCMRVQPGTAGPFPTEMAGAPTLNGVLGKQAPRPKFRAACVNA